MVRDDGILAEVRDGSGDLLKETLIESGVIRDLVDVLECLGETVGLVLGVVENDVVGV